MNGKVTTPTWGLSACHTVHLLKTGAVTPIQLVREARKRVEETDGVLNAVPEDLRGWQQAEQQAQQLMDQGWPMKQDPTSPKPPWFLYGLPVMVKDLTAVQGLKYTCGSRLYKDRVASHDDTLIATLKEAGAIVMAKTNTPEFGAGAQTWNDLYGTTLNPFDTRLTPGGSSGGSTVALAVGQAWLATGTDVGGSLRIPASFCGVLGLRPTPGLVAHDGYKPARQAQPTPECPPGSPPSYRPPSPSPSLSLLHLPPPGQLLNLAGPMARNAGDLALCMDAMSHGGPRAGPSACAAAADSSASAATACAATTDAGGSDHVTAHIVALNTAIGSNKHAASGEGGGGRFMRSVQPGAWPSLSRTLLAATAAVPPIGHSSSSQQQSDSASDLPRAAPSEQQGGQLVVAYSEDLGLGPSVAPVDPEVADICARGAQRLAAVLGARYVQGEHPDVHDAVSVFRVLRAHRLRSLGFMLEEPGASLIKEEMLGEVRRGISQPPQAVEEATAAHAAYCERFESFLSTHHLLATPCVITPPFDANTRWLRHTPQGHTFQEYTDWLILTYAISLVPCPALSLPVGFTKGGLPVGLQLVARPGADEVLVAAAAEYERAHPECCAAVPMVQPRVVC